MALPAECEQSLFRIAGEALFNTAVHGEASRAVVRLAYTCRTVRLTISDDGVGRPEEVRRSLRAASAAPSGEHRGLVGDHAHRPAAQPGEAGEDVVGVAAVDLEELAVVHHPAHHLVHVVGLVGAVGNQVEQRLVPSIRRIVGRTLGRIVEALKACTGKDHGEDVEAWRKEI